MLKNEKEMKQAKELCKNYLGARIMIKTAISSLESMNTKLKDADTEKEKIILSYAIERRNRQIEEANAMIEEYERCLIRLPEEERMVIDQLYGKGCKWTEVKNLEGTILSEKEVITVWKRAIRRIAGMLS